MPSKALKVPPTFKSEAQERTFWKTHDATDYLDLSKAQRVTLPNLKSGKFGDVAQRTKTTTDAPAKIGDERC